MANRETIKLEYPIEIDGVKVAELKLRRPKVRDSLASEKSGGSNAEKEVRLFANLAEQTTDTIEDLDMLDYGKLQEAYTGFLSSLRKKPGKDA